MSDLISRRAAIEALWKALFDYEDKTEKQFAESDDLDICDWIQHRVFVQNMSDIDRHTILNLPSAQPKIIRCKDCKWWNRDPESVYGYCMAIMHGYHSSNWEIGIYRKYKGDFYCADAERRTE